MTPEAAAALLGVALDATPDTIEAAYKRRARTTHPDRFAGEPGDSHAGDFIAATEARDLLLRRVVPVRRPVRRRSPLLLWTWIGLFLIAVFLLTYGVPTPLTIAEPVVRFVVLGGALIGYALTGRRVWMVLTIIALAATAVLTLLFTSIGGLLGLLLLVAPVFGLLLMGVDAAKRRLWTMSGAR